MMTGVFGKCKPETGHVARLLAITCTPEGARPKLHPPASQNVIDVMSKENRQQQTSDATNPEEKMLGQLWGINLLLVHD